MIIPNKILIYLHKNIIFECQPTKLKVRPHTGHYIYNE